jgi:hypothetical protein
MMCGFRVRYFGPVVLVALSLLHQQAAVELEECPVDMIALENERVRVLLRAVGAAADQPEERDLHARPEAAFATYLARWHAVPPPDHPAHETVRRDATRYLETAVHRPCEEFILSNVRRIEASAATHERKDVY